MPRTECLVVQGYIKVNISSLERKLNESFSVVKRQMYQNLSTTLCQVIFIRTVGNK